LAAQAISNAVCRERESATSMPVIAVINRKGGSGKITLAAHLAARFAHDGHTVMLGDVDRQQSTRAWLRRRSPALPPIQPWAIDQKNVMRVPPGISHVVLDTPGGLHGFELARTVMFVDTILLPVCHSAFDREAAASCHAELMALPRVASGRCRVAAIGMRIDARTRAAQTLADWAAELKLPFLGVLRETQLYVQCLERGMTVFDLSPQKAAADLAQWAPIVHWLAPPPPPKAPEPASAPAKPLGSSLPASLMPAQGSMLQGARLSGSRGYTPVPVASFQVERPTLVRPDGPGGAQLPSFLRQPADVSGR
jgi:chromosome partitioning protein